MALKGQGSTMRALVWGMGLMLCLSVGAGCSRLALVKNPVPFPAATSMDATEQAILDGLPDRGWSAEEVTPGRVVAFLTIRRHLVRVEITYDQHEVFIAYLDSDQLGEQDRRDGVYAHRNVNRWMRNLSASIRASIEQTGYFAEGASPPPRVEVQPAATEPAPPANDEPDVVPAAGGTPSEAGAVPAAP